MSLFHLFKPRPKLTQAEQQWNKMWDLWAQGSIPSPYRELMNYQSEVNNGGHAQYFCNTADNYDLKAEVETLLTILPPVHAENLLRSYAAFVAMDDLADVETPDSSDAYDNVFYDNEEFIIDLLKQFAKTIVLLLE